MGKMPLDVGERGKKPRQREKFLVGSGNGIRTRPMGAIPLFSL